MFRRSFRFLALLFGALMSACAAPHAKPIDESVTVRVATSDSTKPAQFTVDVAGGKAELRAPQMHGWATDARLIAWTPADVILHPGTMEASFRALDGRRLAVVAVAPQVRLFASGGHVRITSTTSGLSIRDY